MENLMLIESHWKWMARPTDGVCSTYPIIMCECGRRKAIMNFNNQRWCKPCAIESGEFEVDDFE